MAPGRSTGWQLRLGLALLLLLGAGCRGVAGSGDDGMYGAGAVGSGARISEGAPPSVAIDRGCSRLQDPSDEFVCLTNRDSRPAEMGSWVLRNVLGRSYNFPPGFTLQPGQSVRVHTGSGTDSATDLYWGYRVNPAWESGDKLTLHNSENVEVFVSAPTG